MAKTIREELQVWDEQPNSESTFSTSFDTWDGEDQHRFEDDEWDA